jgi:hypothetical protein
MVMATLPPSLFSILLGVNLVSEMQIDSIIVGMVCVLVAIIDDAM